MKTPRTKPAAWSFDGMGPEFEKHAASHLPGYQDVQALVALIATFCVPVAGLVADLGASTGKTASEVLRAIPMRKLRFCLYDSDASMLDIANVANPGATTVLGELGFNRKHCGLTHHDADLTVALWFLQFVSPKDRLAILTEARVRSADSGLIVVGAKTRHADPRWDEIAIGALDDYKAAAGISEGERVAKTKSLRGVLNPETSGDIANTLRLAGWHSPTVVWRWHVWTVMGAYASELAGDV